MRERNHAAGFAKWRWSSVSSPSLFSPEYLLTLSGHNGWRFTSVDPFLLGRPHFSSDGLFDLFNFACDASYGFLTGRHDGYGPDDSACYRMTDRS